MCGGIHDVGEYRRATELGRLVDREWTPMLGRTLTWKHIVNS